MTKISNIATAQATKVKSGIQTDFLKAQTVSKLVGYSCVINDEINCGFPHVALCTFTRLSLKPVVGEVCIFYGTLTIRLPN